jgi:hypothetical protein
MSTRAFAVLAALAAVAVALVVALPASAAGNAGSTQVSTFDPTGAVFTCPGTNYTVLGGKLHFVFHDTIAANGSEHITGTNTPMGVTLSDGTTSTVYRFAGAEWFGGSFNAATGMFVMTSTDHFNILGPSGGVVGRVSGVAHASSGGANFTFTFGACQEPQD